MSEPTRLSRSNGLGGALLAAAKADAAPPGSARRALAGVAVVAGVSSVATQSSVAVTGATKVVSALHTAARWATWKWIAVGVASASSVVTVGVTVSTKLAARAAEATPVVVAPPSAPVRGVRSRGTRRTPPPVSDVPLGSALPPEVPPPPEPILAPASPTLAPPPSPLPQAMRSLHPSVAPVPLPASAAVTAASGASSASARHAAPTPASSRLASEILALDGAKRRLAAGSPDDALRDLDAYFDAYPHGVLAAEASALRVEALARSGRQAEALAAFTRFREDHPGSPLLENLSHQIVAAHGAP